MPRSRRFLAALFALWACLTLVSWWLYHAAAAGDHTPGVAQSSAVKLASNVVQTLCVPGWVIARILTHRTLHGWWTPPLAVGIGWAVIFLPLSLLVRIRAALAAAKPQERPIDTARRRLVVNGVFVGGAGAVGLPGAHATLVAPWDLRTTRYEIPIRNLPPELEGFKCALLSDTHLGARVPAAFLQRVVAQTLALRPDVVLLTGDYVHSEAELAPAAAAIFAPFIEERIPTLAVMGNHDYYAGIRQIRGAFDAAGVRVVENSAVFIDADRRLCETAPASGLAITGVEDLEMGDVSFEAALRGIPADMPRLLLAHEPDTAELPELRDPPFRVDLMLSGHTHGGQVKLPFIGTPIVPSAFGSKYAAGLVQGPACRVLVSRGIGTSIVPVRWGVPPEVVLVTLTRA
ncbi:MAG: metallophosphoesterase, partial [Phycisphaerales bacterium]